MSFSVLHVLSQRPGLTGSGVGLNALVEAAGERGWRQAAVVGTPTDDPAPAVGALSSAYQASDSSLDAVPVHPLVFPSERCPFALPGMSDVMPYDSSVFSKLSPDQIRSYCEAWRGHVAGVVDQFKPDIIHSHHVWLLSSMLKDVAPGTPIVTHCHATGLRQLELCPHLAGDVRHGCRRNDHFVVLHGGHAGQLTEQLGIDADRISVVGSGFNPEVFHATGRAGSCGHSILYAGKLSRAKGVPWLLDAMTLLNRRIPHVRLHVAGTGSGSEADTIRDRMNHMDCVEYHGQIAQSQLAELLRSAAVFVLPSFYEGLPLVLVEAAACGCRLVSTGLPGVLDQLADDLTDRLECIPLPRLSTIDEPVAEDLPDFVTRLAGALERAVTQPPPPMTTDSFHGLTWDGVFQRVEAVWHRVIDQSR